MSKKYQIVFTGKLAEKKERASAVASLAKVFHTSPGKVERLLADPPVVLKSGLDPSGAKKYRMVFENAGLICITRPMPASSEASPRDRRDRKTGKVRETAGKDKTDVRSREKPNLPEKGDEPEKKKGDENQERKTESTDRYDLVLLGPLSPEIGRDVLKVALAGIFNTDFSQIEDLLSTLPKVIKRNTDLKTATKWQAMLEKAGARCHIRKIKSEQQDSNGAEQTSSRETDSKPSHFAGERTCPKCNHAMGNGPGCMYCGFDTKSGKSDLPPPPVLDSVSKSAREALSETEKPDFTFPTFPLMAEGESTGAKKKASKKRKLLNAALAFTLLVLVAGGISYFLFQDLQSGMDRIDRASGTGVSTLSEKNGTTLSEVKRRPAFSSEETDLEKILKEAFAGENLSEIQDLDLGGANISDIEALRPMTGLKSLNLSSTKVADIDPLGDLSQLTRLNLKDTPVDDISAISDLYSLTVLDLSGTQVSDISSLRWLTRLTRLNLSRTIVDNIDPISELFELSYLDISYTRVADLRPIRGLFHLRVLDITATPVDTLAQLSGHPGIARLSISKTDVRQIDPLENVENLSFLKLGKKQVPEDQLRNLKIAHPGMRIRFENQ